MSEAGCTLGICCQDLHSSADLYVDGELSEAECREIESHIEACPACAELIAGRHELKGRLNRLSGEFAAPVDFMQRIEASICACEMVCEDTAVSASSDSSRRIPRAWFGLAAAAVIACGVGWVTLNVSTDNAAPSGESVEEGQVAGLASINSPIVEESVGWYRRDVPPDVTGPHAWRVQHWFRDKVDFRVELPSVNSGTQLLGGRLAHVGSSDAIQLQYLSTNGRFSVMIFDADEFPLPLEEGEIFVDNSDGFNVAVEQREGLTYTYTTEMAADQVESIAAAAF